MSIKYRPEVNGLRALAVVPVVLFHAKVSGFSGGFVGVDVFFVISGYLITAILHRDLSEGRYSVLDFYERRVRRIVPALIALLSVVALASPFLLLPSQLENLPSQLIGTLAFAANIVLWRQTDYFSPKAEGSPLLHMWSLGVEEQFYIFAPFALAILVRRTPRLLGPVILALALGSFAFSVAITVIKPTWAFYLLPTRAWELLVGSAIAVGFFPRVELRWLRESLVWLGMACLLGAITLFDEAIAFPGYSAGLPVLGAGLVIAYSAGTSAVRVLSSRLLVGIGIISYSLYLWHWPFIVFADNAGLLGSAVGVACVVLASFLSAWISWYFVEQPFRTKSAPKRPVLFGWAAIATIALATLGGGLWLAGSRASFVSAAVAAIDLTRNDFSPMRASCHVSQGLPRPDDACVFGTGPIDLVVWGDSHGVELSYALAEHATVHSITYSACPPVTGFEIAGRPSCVKHNQEVMDYVISQPDLKIVVLAARHSGYIDDPVYQAGFVETVGVLRAAGKRVVLVGPVPSPGLDLPTYLARGYLPTIPVEDFLATEAKVLKFLDSVPSVDVIEPATRLCRNDDCTLIVNGMPTLFDDNHPSMTMAREIAEDLICRVNSLVAASTACEWRPT